MKTPTRVSAASSLTASIGATWTRFWFTPAEPWPLAVVRILGGLLALALWASYAGDLETWFGPFGMISPALLGAWRSPYAVSLFDLTTSSAGLAVAYGLGGLVLVAVTIGLATPVTTVLGAIAFAAILHRGPMLVGPADDVVAVILWCLAIGRSGDSLSVDRLVGAWRGGRFEERAGAGVRDRELRLAKGGDDGVDRGDSLGQEGVCGQFRELAAPKVRRENLLAWDPSFVDLGQSLDRRSGLTADQDSVGSQ
jgi:hypothetical protein